MVLLGRRRRRPSTPRARGCARPSPAARASTASASVIELQGGDPRVVRRPLACCRRRARRSTLRAERDGRVVTPRRRARSATPACCSAPAARRSRARSTRPWASCSTRRSATRWPLGEPIVTSTSAPPAAATPRSPLLREAIVVGSEAPARAPARPRRVLALSEASAPMERLLSLLGLLVFLGIAWALSTDRKAIRLRTILWGLGLQFALALFVLKTPFGQDLFSWMGAKITRLLNLSFVGLRVRLRRARDPGRRPARGDGDAAARAAAPVGIAASASSSPSRSCPRSSSSRPCSRSSTTSA